MEASGAFFSIMGLSTENFKDIKRLRDESLFVYFFFINFTKKLIYAIGKATGGLVQHGFCKMRGYSIMIMWNFLAAMVYYPYYLIIWLH